MQLPGPVRAAVGLLASAADEARRLPDRAIELPMLAVSSALQASLRAQQRYARLAARGDDVLNRRRPSSAPPAWATFDATPDADAGDPHAGPDALDDPDPQRRARAASQLLDELLGGPGGDAAIKRPPSGPANKPAKRTAGTRTAGTRTAGTRAPARAAADDDGRKPPAKGSAKKVNRPRHTEPSAFDTVDDE